MKEANGYWDGAEAERSWPPYNPPIERTFPVVDPAVPVRGEEHPKPNNFAARYFERWSCGGL